MSTTARPAQPLRRRLLDQQVYGHRYADSDQDHGNEHDPVGQPSQRSHPERADEDRSEWSVDQVDAMGAANQDRHRASQCQRHSCLDLRDRQDQPRPAVADGVIVTEVGGVQPVLPRVAIALA